MLSVFMSFATCDHPQQKGPQHAGPARAHVDRRSALARLVALVDLVDDVNAAATAHELVGTVPRHQRLERIADLHRATFRQQKEARGALWVPAELGAKR